MSERSTLGVVIRRRRLELGWTQEELAERISADGEYVRQSEISRIENGKIDLPRRERLARIAAVLDLPLGELLSRSGWAEANQHFDERVVDDGSKLSEPSQIEQQPVPDQARVVRHRQDDGSNPTSMTALRKAMSTMRDESERLVRNRALTREIIERMPPKLKTNSPTDQDHSEPTAT